MSSLIKTGPGITVKTLEEDTFDDLPNKDSGVAWDSLVKPEKPIAARLNHSKPQ